MTDFCVKVQQLGKSFSSPSRYKIIETLLDGPKTVNEIVVAVKLSQPAVSQHLSTLKSCDVVIYTKKGQEVEYALNTKHILEILKTMASDVSKCKNQKIS